MKKNLFRVFLFSILTLMFVGFSFAQKTTRDVSAGANKFVISAEAGGVNYVEGKVTVLNPNTSRSGIFLKGDNLKVGEEVSTGADGKAEILLNPGSFVRLGTNTNFEFETTSLDDLKLKLNKGSAMFEVITDDNFKISVNTPKATFYLIKSGIYRLDVLEDGSGRLEVRKGKAQIGDSEATTIKKKKSATFDGDDVAVAKFDRDNKDSLELWSESRSELLAKVNSQLQTQNLRNSLIYGFNNNTWNFYGSYGLWAFSPRFGGYCFLPFGYGWRSPYGFGYGSNIWSYGFPTYLYNQQIDNRRRDINVRPTDPNRNPPNKVKQPPFTRIDDGLVTRKNRDIGTPGDERRGIVNDFPTTINRTRAIQDRPVSSQPATQAPIRKSNKVSPQDFEN